MTRLLPALTVAALLAAVTLLYAWDPALYFAARVAAGLKPYAPFLDLHGVLAAIECHHRGIDVYAENPCDTLGRLHGYSPLWLRLPAWAGSPALLNPLGLLSGASFAAALLLLPGARGRCGTLALLLAAVSPVTFFALERANIDVPIFAAIALGGVLLGGGIAARWAGYGLFLLVGLLKFYPLVLLALLAREPRRLGLAVAAAAALVALAALGPLHAEIGPALANLPQLPAFSSSFGLPVLGKQVAAVLPQAAWAPGLATALAGALAGAVGWQAWRHAAAGLPPRHGALLRAGGLAALACFLAGENVEYRAVLLLLPLPALLWQARHGAAPRLASAAVGAVLWVMWDPLLRRAVARLWPGAGTLPSPAGLAFWGLREALWWFGIGIIAGLLAASWRVDTTRAPIGIIAATEGNEAT